jgi:anti-sigma regulatory factor (Ser/Thr protein kinase)
MRTSLVADLRAPSAARAFVQQHLDPNDRDEPLKDKVVLVVSELVTNAVRAGATGVDLALDVTARRVVLMVDDDAEGWPTMTTATREAARGRGLRIVDQVADDWKVSSRPGGKRVTAVWGRSRDAS